MIRYSKKEDAEDITKLANKYLYDCYLSELKNNKDAILMKHNIECVRNIILDKTNPTFVYEEDNIICGFISLCLVKSCSIILISVDENKQNKGIGSALLTRALSEFKTDYYLNISVYNPLKEKLIKYYSKFGFEVYEEYIKMIKKFL